VSERVDILYTGCHGGRGNTLPTWLLGQVPGFVNVGEFCHLRDRDFQEDQLCGYEQPRIGFRPVLFAWGWTKSRGPR